MAWIYMNINRGQSLSAWIRSHRSGCINEFKRTPYTNSCRFRELLPDDELAKTD